MNFDDSQVPEDVVIAVWAASSTLPAQAWDLDGLRARAGSVRRRRRAWGRWLGAVVAGAVAMIAAGSAAVVLNPGSRTEPGGDPQVLSVYSVDPQHLYAVRAACRSCREELLGSDDGGVTWTRRTNRTDSQLRLTVGPTGALMIEGSQFGQPATAGPAVSSDGGRTWRAVVDDPTPWDTIPAGGILGCDRSPQCPLAATDPVTGRRSPLAHQPTASAGRAAVIIHGTLWIDGPGADRQRTTVSRDRGRTWSTATVDCPPVDCLGEPLVPGLDGATVYRVRTANHDGDTVFERSLNAGASWQSFIVTGAATADPLGGSATGAVAPDGSLIVIRFAMVGPDPEAWILRPTDPQPQPVRLTGLTGHIGRALSTSLTGNADTGYLFQPGQGETVYRSLDGLTWRPLVVRPAP